MNRPMKKSPEFLSGCGERAEPFHSLNWNNFCGTEKMQQAMHVGMTSKDQHFPGFVNGTVNKCQGVELMLLNGKSAVIYLHSNTRT